MTYNEILATPNKYTAYLKVCEVYDSFVKQLTAEDITDELEPEDLIYCAFEWGYSLKGHGFWSKLNQDYQYWLKRFTDED